jgi:hypothetical protein
MIARVDLQAWAEWLEEQSANRGNNMTYHVRHFHGDRVHPLLPDVPVDFIERAGVTAPGTTFSGNLSLRKRCVVLFRVWSRRGVGQ